MTFRMCWISISMMTKMSISSGSEFFDQIDEDEIEIFLQVFDENNFLVFCPNSSITSSAVKGKLWYIGNFNYFKNVRVTNIKYV